MTKESYTIGIDIGGTKTLLVLLDESQNIFYEKKITSSNGWEFLEILIKKALNEVSIEYYQVCGMGIGVAGSIDRISSKVIDAPGLKWIQFDLISKLKTHFSFPIFINNDVNCALLGESKIGAAKDCDPILFISIGTGLGCALMSGGKLINGANNMAGEIGYQLDKNDYVIGKTNKLGQFGIAESKISGTALKTKFSSSEEFFLSLEKKQDTAVELFDELSMNLSILIANAVCLINPEKVILGGGLSQPLKPYLEVMDKKIAELIPIPTQIELSQLNETAGALGAAYYALEELEKR
jgi:glucokinase